MQTLQTTEQSTFDRIRNILERYTVEEVVHIDAISWEDTRILIKLFMKAKQEDQIGAANLARNAGVMHLL